MGSPGRSSVPVVWAFALLMVAAVACVSGDYANTEFRCGDGESCPAGYSCIDLVCVGEGLQPGAGDTTGGDGDGDPPGGDGDGDPPGGDPVGGDGDGDGDGDPPDPNLFVASNIPDELVDAGTAALILDAPDLSVRIDTDLGTIIDRDNGADLRPAGVEFNVVAQPDGAPNLGVFSATDITIGNDVEVRVVGSAALVLAASGAVSIDADIDANGGYDGDSNAGPGGFAGGLLAAPDGLGPGGGKGIGPAEAAADVGGGGAGYLAVGGAGGDAAGGVGFAGGVAYGSPTLVPLIGGSGGGAGGDRNADTEGGLGGGGGGALQISARGSVELGDDASINVGGGGGEGGDGDDAGGGGGSGGAVLIEAPSISIAGVIAANGGGGGAGANVNLKGDDGNNGRSSIQPASGGTGVGEGADGGNGGAGGDPAGAKGGDALLGDNVLDNAGGGGGAAGRIRLRSPLIDIAQAVLSPTGGVNTGGF